MNVIRSMCYQISVVGALVLPITSEAMEPTPSADQAANSDTRAVTSNALQGPSVGGIIVKFRESAPDSSLERATAMADQFARASGVSIQSLTSLATDATLLNFADSVPLSEAQAIADSIAANDPNILYAEPDALMQIQQANDTRFGEQWHLFEPSVSINLPGAWSVPASDKEIVVAIVDTGILAHEDLDGRVLPGFDFISDPFMGNDEDGRDDNPTDAGDASDAFECGPFVPARPRNSWHGLHVGGTVAAVTNNNLGVAGVGDDVKILPIRVLGKCGGRLSDIVTGMLWAIGESVESVPDNDNPAHVLNLSLGGQGNCGPFYTDAIRKARQKGVTVVVAAGNSDSDASQFRPANCEGVITVAATNRAGARAYFGRPGAGSNFGSTVEVSAPGGETHQSPENGILSTLNSGSTAPGQDSYEFYQGTSMAAPHVAGIAALMYQANPAITPDEVMDVLQKTSQSFPIALHRQCNTNECGAGIVDAGAALSKVREGSSAKLAK